MNKILTGMALTILVFAPTLVAAQSMPNAAVGTDVGAQASRATSDAVGKAAQQAVEDARKDKARPQAEAEQKSQPEAPKAPEPAK